MAEGIYSWSKNPDSNQTADQNINWLENQDPSTVNNSSRQEMSEISGFRDDLGAVALSTGTEPDYEVASADIVGSPNHRTINTAYQDGHTIWFKIHAGNTNKATLNVNGIGTIPLRGVSGVELAPGQLTAGQVIGAFFSAGEFIMVGSSFGTITTGDLSPALQTQLVQVGHVRPAFTVAPEPGWLRLDGAIYNVADYPVLGALYGDRYGGDGALTFGVPDTTDLFLRGRADAPIDLADRVAPTGSGAAGEVGSTQSWANGNHVHDQGTLRANDTGTDSEHTHNVGYLERNSESSGGGVNLVQIIRSSGPSFGTDAAIAGTNSRHEHQIDGNTGVASGQISNVEGRPSNMYVDWVVLADLAAASGSAGPFVVILDGTTDPDDGADGAEGDFYVNTTTTTWFGPKAGGVWPTGVSLIGAAGANGTDGASFVWQDTWISANPYVVNDVVAYDDGTGISSYICNTDTSTTTTPDLAPQFDLMAEAGQDGLAGSGFTWRGTYSLGDTYAVDDVVSRDSGVARGDDSYICIQANAPGTALPEVSPAFWEILAQGGDDALGLTAAYVRFSNQVNTLTSTDADTATLKSTDGSVKITIAPASQGDGDIDFEVQGPLNLGTEQIQGGLFKPTNITFVGGDNPDIIGGDNQGVLSITADTNASQGGNLKLYADGHPSNAGDFHLRSDANIIIDYDKFTDSLKLNATDIIVNNEFKVENTIPVIALVELGEPTDNKYWGIRVNSQQITFNIADDAGGSIQAYMIAKRSGLTVDEVEFPGDAFTVANAYQIGGVEVLSATTLGPGVVNSSLQAVDIIGSGTWQGTPIGVSFGGTGAANKTDGFDALSPLSTKGDLIGFNDSSGDNVRVPVGLDDLVLVADAAAAVGFKWGTIPGGGGTVFGPGGSNVDNFATWNSTDGTIIKDGGIPGALAFLSEVDTNEIAIGAVATSRLEDPIGTTSGVTNAKLAHMIANSVKARAAGTTGSPNDLPIAANNFVGRHANDVQSLSPNNASTILDLADDAFVRSSVHGIFGVDLTFTQANPNILGGDTNGVLSITPAAATGLGGNIKLYGDTHATQAQDIEFRANSTVVLHWDESANAWIFAGTISTGVREGTPIATAFIADEAVTNAKLADMNAHSFKVRLGGTTGVPSNLALGDNSFAGRNTGNLEALDANDAMAILDLATSAPARLATPQTFTAGQRKQITELDDWDAPTTFNLDDSNDFNLTTQLTGAEGLFPLPVITGMANGTAQSGEITLSALANTAGFHASWEFPGGTDPDIAAAGEYTLYYRVWKESGGTPHYRITTLDPWST